MIFCLLQWTRRGWTREVWQSNYSNYSRRTNKLTQQPIKTTTRFSGSDVTGQHYRRLPSDVSLPRISERRRRLKFRLELQVQSKWNPLEYPGIITGIPVEFHRYFSGIPAEIPENSGRNSAGIIAGILHGTPARIPLEIYQNSGYKPRNHPNSGICTNNYKLSTAWTAVFDG